jgi:hypothetical protein
MNGRNHCIYHHPQEKLDLSEEISFQYDRLAQGLRDHRRGMYCFDKVKIKTGEEIIGLYGDQEFTAETFRFDYAPSEPGYPTYIMNFHQAEDGDLNEDSDDGRLILTMQFSPITLLLCGQHSEFKKLFIDSYQLQLRSSGLLNPRNPEKIEKTAFLDAFERLSELPALPKNHPEILKIQNHRDSKPKYNLHSPKKLFMNALIEASTLNARALPHQKRAVAEMLFDTANHPRIRENTGFWAWLHAIVDAFRGKKHQTKTFRFAKVFFNPSHIFHGSNRSDVAGQEIVTTL